MPNVVLLRDMRKRRHHFAATSKKPNTAGSAFFPLRFRRPEKRKNNSAGIRPRAFQLETAGVLTLANSAAFSLPPTASTTSSTDLSMAPDKSQSVNKSRVHIREIENVCESGRLPRMGARPHNKRLNRRPTGRAPAGQADWLGYGERVRQALGAVGIIQARAADDSKVARNTFNQYLQGKREIPPKVACKLKKIYGITADWIYCADPSGLPNHIRSKVIDDL